jgi:hypothetical protein
MRASLRAIDRPEDPVIRSFATLRHIQPDGHFSIGDAAAGVIDGANGIPVTAGFRRAKYMT